MTKAPHTIAHDQPLSGAHRLMNANGIRHLPVLEGGKLVGILSQRDLHFIETLRDVDPEDVPVSEAMTAEVFHVSPHAGLRKVAAEMAEHKYGSAVVMDKGHVVGMLTTVDVVRALLALLDGGKAANG